MFYLFQVIVYGLWNLRERTDLSFSHKKRDEWIYRQIRFVFKKLYAVQGYFWFNCTEMIDDLTVPRWSISTVEVIVQYSFYHRWPVCLSGKGSLAELFVLNTLSISHLMGDVELNDRFKNLDATSLLVSTADSAVSQ